jgi:hypothetical protein
MHNPRTDWRIIADAVAFYESHDYQYVEAPWFAPDCALMTTCPSPELIIRSQTHGGLVGSAEQSFVALDMEGKLGRGSFVAATPCFRNEPMIDGLHQSTFVKVELYRNDKVDMGALHDMVAAAQAFFYTLTDDVRVETSSEGYDLVLNGVEIGSYGIRQSGKHKWLFGTGVAEPRFSIAFANRFVVLHQPTPVVPDEIFWCNVAARHCVRV